MLEWGALLILAGLINFIFIGFLQFPVATFGLLLIPTYPLPLAVFGALALIGASRLTYKPGAATLTVFLLAFHTVFEELFVPWAIRTAVVQQGMSYRIPGEIPYFNATDALLPLIFIISALIVDGVAFWRQHKGYPLGGYTRGIWLLGSNHHHTSIDNRTVSPIRLIRSYQQCSWSNRVSPYYRI